jgi:hypothetical protein
MSDFVSGSVTVFFLFDVGEAIQLSTLRGLIEDTVAAPLTPKQPTPSYVQYQQAPVSIDGQAAGAAEIEGFRVRFKLFDYGVVSLALTRATPPTWDSLLAEGLRWYENPALAASAEAACRRLADRIQPAIVKARQQYLYEDYLVFTAAPPAHGETSADALLASHGASIAQLLRGERDPLSAQERDEVLRNRISYLASDLVVPTWNGAFVYDTEAGAQAALEILEFANSQLLEFRYYDQLLDGELERIYMQLQRPGFGQHWFNRRYTQAARHVLALFIDVNELTDKTENALKIAGDVYAARLFALAAARLGLDQWKANVREKLKTLDDIYRFAVEQTAMARGELLELTVVLILVVELVFFFAGIMD